MAQIETQSGIHLHMSSNPTAIIKEADGTTTVKVESLNKKSNKQSNNSGDKDSKGDQSSSSSSNEVLEIRGNQQVVLAVGRGAKTKGLGLEEVGVEMGESKLYSSLSMWKF